MTTATTHPVATQGHLITSQARWGPILAGVVVALAVLCFFQMLGLAIGVSIVDLSDGDAMGSGFGIGVAIWATISWIASLFLGALLTARLSGERNAAVGLLNGVILWASTSLLVTVLAFTSLTSILGGTFSLASSAVSASASAVGSAGRAVGSAASSITGESPFADEVIALLKDEASQAIAGGPDGPSAQEVRQSIDQLDAEAMRAVATHLIDGDIDAAVGELADRIAMSEADLRRVLERASQQVQQMIGTADSGQPLSQDVLNEVKSALASRLAELDSAGGTDVAESDIRAALDDLDVQVMRTIAWRLIQGDADGARDAVIANTSLSRREANELIDGVQERVTEVADTYMEQAEEYAETAADYAQQVLWVSVLVSILSLAASAAGGWIGTLELPRRTTRTTRTTEARSTR